MPDNGSIQKRDAHEMAHGRPVQITEHTTVTELQPSLSDVVCANKKLQIGIIIALVVLACIAGLSFAGREIPTAVLAALLLAVIRYVVVAFEVRRIARRLGEGGIAGRYFIYDLLGPLWAAALGAMLLRRDNRVWR